MSDILVTLLQPDEIAVTLEGVETFEISLTQPDEIAVTLTDTGDINVNLVQPENILLTIEEVSEIAVTLSQPEEIAVTLSQSQGEPGRGIPEGGNIGQVLSKKSIDDYDSEWVDNSGGGGSSYFPSGW